MGDDRLPRTAPPEGGTILSPEFSIHSVSFFNQLRVSRSRIASRRSHSSSASVSRSKRSSSPLHAAILYSIPSGKSAFLPSSGRKSKTAARFRAASSPPPAEPSPASPTSPGWLSGCRCRAKKSPPVSSPALREFPPVPASPPTDHIKQCAGKRFSPVTPSSGPAAAT